MEDEKQKAIEGILRRLLQNIRERGKNEAGDCIVYHRSWYGEIRK